MPRRRSRAGGFTFRCPWGTEIQSLLFPKSDFDPSDVHDWLARYGFRATLDSSTNFWHARQREPSTFMPGSLRTITLGRGASRVRAIVGCPLSPRRHRR